MTQVRARSTELQPFEAALERLSADAHALFEGLQVTFEPAGVQERPFSHVLRLRVRRKGSAAPLTHVFLKIFKWKVVDGREDGMQRRILHDFTTTNRVYEAMKPWPGYTVVRPVACYPDQLALITEEAQGRTLLDCLQTDAAWFPGAERVNQLCDAAHRVGRWLRLYQSVEERGGSVAVDDLKDYIDVRLTRMAGHRTSGFTEVDRQRVLGHIDRLALLVPPEDLQQVAVHSDMSLGNVLVTSDTVVVLDFAMARRGTALHDLTRLYVQVELLAVKPRFRARVLEEIQRALLDGFDASMTSDRPLFRLLSLLHRVNHLATLSTNRSAFPEAMYNRLVRGRHRQWLEAEIARGAGAPVSR